MLNVEPSLLRVGAVHVSVAEPFDTSLTAMLKAGSDAEVLPSLTRITIFEYEPACALLGVPESRPVEVLNVAHDGLFEMLNVSASPFASLAVGVKLYALPTPTDVVGVPEMRGAELLLLEPAVTVIEKADKAALVLPSLTRIKMLLNLPTLEFVGVPDKRPVDVLNAAHEGLFEMLNVSLSPFASLAVGVKA